MKKLILPFMSLSIMALGTTLNADELDSVFVSDTLEINPNTSEAESYNRVSPTSSDGGEFLTQINGVSMSRFGGRGLEPIIRGQAQTRLNILLDGAYIHGGCPNRMDPPASWAALETYENVTVLKGVQSLIYGAGGSGGTVLFERDTRDLAEEKGLHGRISAMGSDNAIEHDVLADVVAANNKGYVRGIGEIKKAKNYEDGDGREVRSSYDHEQAGIIIGLTPTEDRLFELSYEKNAFSDALYPGAGMDSPTEDGDIFRLRYLDKPATDKIDSIKAEAYLSDVDHLMNNYSLRKPPKYMGISNNREFLLATPKIQNQGVLFYDKVSDYILRDTARGQAGILKSDGADIYRNVDAELYGLELESKMALSPKLDLTGSLAFVRATNTTDNRPIPQTPPINGKLQLDYNAGKWGMGSRVNFAARQDRIDTFSKQEVGETAGHATLDVYANYKMNKTFSIRAGVDNVLNKNYAEHASRSNILDNYAVKVNEPGRTAWLKLTAEF